MIKYLPTLKEWFFITGYINNINPNRDRYGYVQGTVNTKNN